MRESLCTITEIFVFTTAERNWVTVAVDVLRVRLVTSVGFVFALATTVASFRHCIHG